MNSPYGTNKKIIKTGMALVGGTLLSVTCKQIYNYICSMDTKANRLLTEVKLFESTREERIKESVRENKEQERREEGRYSEFLESLFLQKEKAFEQMKQGEYEYALLEVRKFLERSTDMLIIHYLGENHIHNFLAENLAICQENNLLNTNIEVYEKLHGVRKICGKYLHSGIGYKSPSHNEVHFAVMTIKDELALIRLALKNQ